MSTLIIVLVGGEWGQSRRGIEKYWASFQKVYNKIQGVSSKKSLYFGRVKVNICTLYSAGYLISSCFIKSAEPGIERNWTKTKDELFR